ncbi:MAG: SRPBCC family protein [Methylophilaceae bacterium]
MKKIALSSVLISAAVLSACATNGMNSGAAKLSAVEKVTINAPAEKVWSKVSSFGDLGAWHPAVAKTEIVSGTNNEPGAVRQLTLQDGGGITEKLTSYNAASMTYSYVINEGVLPVSDYSSTIVVKPLTASTTEVTWNGDFKRKDTSATPAKGQDDEAATNTIHAVYRGGLDNLKKISE